ncbi:MAG: SpoIVB peptidase [Cellulosilyticaceae bacterium]
MRQKIQDKLFKWLWVSLVCSILASPLVVSYFYLPSEIKIVAGKEYLWDCNIPLCAHIKTKENVILKNKEKSIVSGEKINLKDPLYVSMGEVGKSDMTLSFLGVIPIKTVGVEALPPMEVIPCGQFIGVKIDMEGLGVVGVGPFQAGGKEIEPCKDKMIKGDMITRVNGQSVATKEDFKEKIENSGGKTLKLTVMRKGIKKEVSVTPIYCENEDCYKLGIWIKDSMQGLGTLTYYNPATLRFGALGHGITDLEMKKMIPIHEGEMTTAKLTSIKKGEKGEPGHVGGMIESKQTSVLGQITTNTAQGIYGTINKNGEKYLNAPPIPIALQDEIHEGKAIILANVIGGEVRPYDVLIQKVAKYSGEPTKGMVIQIVDKELLKATNGIVQGMSGSPIIQDGKLIGAVTHVFVQEPTKGYGIFIENMINTDK